MMRKTIAGFEMYIGVRNTAGALTFFTPPQTQSAKKKYEEIRSTNLPFSLKSWSFSSCETPPYMLVVEKIKNGYRTTVLEGRKYSEDDVRFTSVVLELVRDESKENGFAIDRYYTSQYSYQNNLGEEIKCQGFDL